MEDRKCAQAIESAANQLVAAPAPSTVRFYLRNELVNLMTLIEMENSCNEALVDHLPPGICGRAMDLTCVPYHGETANDPKEIRRGKAKSGTTHFHCYATAYVIKKNKCITLALTYVESDDTLVQILERLMSRLKSLNVHLKRLYLDKEFYCVPVIRYFQTQQIIPAIIRGTRALLRGSKSYITTYTMHSE